MKLLIWKCVWCHTWRLVAADIPAAGGSSSMGPGLRATSAGRKHRKDRKHAGGTGHPFAAWCLCKSPSDRNAPRIVLPTALRTEQHKPTSPWPARWHRPCTTPKGQPLHPTGHACLQAPSRSRAALASCAPASKQPAATPVLRRPPAKPTSPPRAEFGRTRQRVLQLQGLTGMVSPPSSLQIAFVKMDAGPSIRPCLAHPCVSQWNSAGTAVQATAMEYLFMKGAKPYMEINGSLTVSLDLVYDQQ